LKKEKKNKKYNRMKKEIKKSKKYNKQKPNKLIQAKKKYIRKRIKCEEKKNVNTKNQKINSNL
jgi:hypothetical protein